MAGGPRWEGGKQGAQERYLQSAQRVLEFVALPHTPTEHLTHRLHIAHHRTKNRILVGDLVSRRAARQQSHGGLKVLSVKRGSVYLAGSIGGLLIGGML